tara:strand:+ start:524 stop:1192 length:669 start_codon:yes stop_codon:yes gene_type:complete
MNTEEVRELFKSYADESDTTFLTDAQITLYLKQGYNDFRRVVCDIDPFIYSKEFLFTMPTSGTLDLTTTTPALLGATSVAPNKLERLLRVARINDTINNEVIRYLDSMSSERTLNTYCYTFVNSKIITYATDTAAFRLEYVPFHNVDFSADPAGAGRYIDDLDGFHDMIPLYAYRRYAIRDGADNVALLQETERKVKDLNTFLESGRSREGSQYVSEYDSRI